MVPEKNSVMTEAIPASVSTGPASTGPASKLPVSAKTLTNLQRAQHQLQPATLESVVQHTLSLTTSSGLDSTASRYILKRLITGASASHGHARPNYATILLRLTKALANSSGADAVDAVIESVASVYDSAGSFDDRYARGRIEKTVGALASVSAVVRGARASDLSVASARSAIKMLRACVAGDATKWNLAPAVGEVLKELLANAKNAKILPQLMKPLWSWAESRSEMHDGLIVALLLRVEYAAIEADAFQRLYPMLDDLAVPLGKMLDTGFPMFGKEVQTDEVSDAFVDLSGIPTAWALTLRYLYTPEAKGHFGGVSLFWKDVVIAKLIFKVKSLEKRTLAAMMFPAAVSCLTESEDYSLILEHETRSMLAQLRSSLSIARKQQAKTEALRPHINLAIEKVDATLQNVFAASRLPADEQAVLAARVMRLTLGRGATIMASDPSSLPAIVVPRFFEAMMGGVLAPEGKGKVVLAARAGYLRCLERVTSANAEFVPVFVHMMIMVGLFSPKESSDVVAPASVSADDFVGTIAKVKAELASQSYSLLLPTPVPVVAEATALVCLRRLIECVLSSSKTDDASARIEMAEKIFNATEKKVDASSKIFGDEAPSIRSSLKLLASAPTSSIQACLSLVGRYLLLHTAFHRRLGSDDKASTALFAKCASSLCGKSDGEEASTLEQTVHLLCSMCVQDAEHAGVAKAGFEMLAGEIDDSVTAVVFDMLDAAMKGEAQEDGEEDEDESDGDDSVLEMSVNGSEDEDEKSPMKDTGATSAPSKGGENAESADDADNGDDDAEKDIMDEDVDPDKEDPTVLAAFDKHLANHVQLMRKQKSAAKETLREQDARVTKLLTMIGAAANRLRLNVEKDRTEWKEKTCAVLLDLFIRLFEFVLSDEYDASKHSERVLTICNRNMVKNAAMIGELSDKTLMGECAERLFGRVLGYGGGRAQVKAVAGPISRCANVVAGVLAKEGKPASEKVAELYARMWILFLDGKSSHVSSNVFVGYSSVFPAEAMKLAARAKEVVLAEESSIRQRRCAMEGLQLLHPAAVMLHGTKPAAAKAYWSVVEELCGKLDEEEMAVWKDEVVLKELWVTVKVGEEASVLERGSSEGIIKLAEKNGVYGKLRVAMRGLKRARDGDECGKESRVAKKAGK